ncbi:hypothetical protein L1987_13834 [Smallanthus sonchifolius]|uniref:Uncharacterized protein n=1 Tax=Smallanthus sonchifolius TaxID=185202 RepID=A0ACB9JIG5_9ASTR|nr:hypothetical protein L1987_13834 [Smallanthus sonchifolius]
MFDQQAKGLEFEKKAESLVSLWIQAQRCCWDQAGAMYCKHEAAEAYANAGRSYKRTNTKECIACLEQALNVFMEIGRLSMYEKYCKEIAELYEQEQNLEQAITYYDRAVDLFEDEEATTYANQCKQKIAQFSAQLGQLLADLAAALEEEGVVKFTDAAKKFDSITRLWQMLISGKDQKTRVMWIGNCCIDILWE